jgi:hypothetical protein
MKNTGISLPETMDDEIRERREKGTSKSEYIRQALRVRFALEDDDNWPPDTVSIEDQTDPDHVDAPADD